MKNKNKFLAILIFGVFALTVKYGNAQVEYFKGGSICPDEDWHLVFEDEFEGCSINSDNWDTYMSGNECPDCRTQHFHKYHAVYQDTNVIVDNGILKLRVWRSDIEYYDTIFPFTAGMLYSKQTFSNYARYEIKCKMPNDKNMLKTFWTHGWESEIDVFEILTSDEIQMTLHNKGLGEGVENCSDYAEHDALDPDDWHIFRADYTPYYVKFYIDDILVRLAARYPETQNGLDLECELDEGYHNRLPCYMEDHKPMHTILWFTPNFWFTDNDAYEENTMVGEWEVDYVRVYQMCGGDEDIYLNKNEELTLTGTHDLGRIFMEEGAVLNIENAQLFFAKYGGITMFKGEVNVSNSTLSTQCDKWDGIFAIYGGDVNIDNSKIEYATKGVLMNPGSTLNISNSRIEDCDIGVDIQKNTENNNINNYTIIQDCEVGIMMNDSRNLVLNHTFLNNENSILISDSDIDIQEGNHITWNNQIGQGNSETQYGLIVTGTYPTGAGIKIGRLNGEKNSFNHNGGNTQDSSVAILCSGVDDPHKAIIVNNIFSGNGFANWATVMNGANFYDFAKNDIIGFKSGIASYSSGNERNYVRCNDYFDNSEAENVFVGFNRFTQFLSNNSQGNSYTNIYPWANNILAGAYMKPEIGFPSNPAGNCFPGNNTLDIVTVPFLSLDGAPFNYYYHKIETANGTEIEDNCERPVTPGNYFKYGVEFEADQCVNIGSFGNIDPDGDGDDGIDTFIIACCLPDILDSVDYWIDVVVDEGGDNPKTSPDENTGLGDDGLYDSEEILDQWINYGIYAAIQTDNYDFAKELLSPMVTMKWKKKWYGINIKFGNYDRASEILEALPTRDQEEIYFKDVQKINLKRFTSIRDSIWKVTPGDIDQLKVVAQSPYPSRGYAWSLYRLLTGKRLSLGLPSLELELERRSDESINEKTMLLNNDEGYVYPNPVAGELNISSRSKEKIIEIKIRGINGDIFYSQKVNETMVKIDVTGYNPGVYLVELELESGKRIHEKVVIN